LTKPKTTRNERRLAKKEKKAKPHKIPRQAPLPGIGDTKIAAIENAALDYAELRDSRQELTKQEVDLKGKLLKLMHARNLTEYKRNGISVKVQVEEETVKVRIRAEEDGEPSKETTVEVSEQGETAPDYSGAEEAAS
jgi:hypothetical protein